MIRPAVPDDIFRLLEMGAAFFVEAGWHKHAEFDRDSFAFACANLMDHGVLLVAEKNGQPVGMMGAGLSPAYWNREVLTSQELFWYCEPKHRDGLGSAMMREMEARLQALGVRLFSMSAEEGLRSTALNRIYRQRGYFPMERLFWKQLGDVAA